MAHCCRSFPRCLSRKLWSKSSESHTDTYPDTNKSAKTHVYAHAHMDLHTFADTDLHTNPFADAHNATNAYGYADVYADTDSHRDPYACTGSNA